MKKFLFISALSFIILFAFTGNSFSQSVKIGPRLTGNLNIYNSKGLTGTWNGVGIGIGGVVDISFSRTIGLLTNLTFFDMRNFSNSQTGNLTFNQQTFSNASLETSLSLSYVTIEPLFKAEFSGFYMVGGPSLGIKINSSGEQTFSAPAQQQGGQAVNNVTSINIETKSVKFDLAVGTGYNFVLSPDMLLGADFMAYIPITDTYNIPATSNSIFTLKFGASLKFRL